MYFSLNFEAFFHPYSSFKSLNSIGCCKATINFSTSSQLTPSLLPTSSQLSPDLVTTWSLLSPDLVTALRKTILTKPPFSSYSGSSTPCALQASTILLTPEPQLSKYDDLKSTSAISGLYGYEACALFIVSGVSASGNLPGFSISTRSSYIAMLGVKLYFSSCLWHRAFVKASLNASAGISNCSSFLKPTIFPLCDRCLNKNAIPASNRSKKLPSARPLSTNSFLSVPRKRANLNPICVKPPTCLPNNAIAPFSTFPSLIKLHFPSSDSALSDCAVAGIRPRSTPKRTAS